MVRTGEFKLMRTIGGVTAFAGVMVSAGESTDEAGVVAVPSRDSPRVWIDSAVGACVRCLDALRAARRVGDATSVVVTHVVGTAVDTTDDAVEAAAVLAVAKAFDLLDDFVLSHDGRWHVDWASQGERIV